MKSVRLRRIKQPIIESTLIGGQRMVEEIIGDRQAGALLQQQAQASGPGWSSACERTRVRRCPSEQ
jgi:hypothetical protein